MTDADTHALTLGCARDFRLAREAEANTAFARIVDALLEPSRASLLPRLAPFLTDMDAAQRRGDTLRVADVLEHVVAPLLLRPGT